MADWFYENFQNPVDCCPYDSGEGGYQYIYGGPYEPHEVLGEEFEGIVNVEVIKDLADELWDESSEWEGRDRESERNWVPSADSGYFDYFFRSLTASAGPLVEFQRSVLDVQTILKDPIADGGVRQLVLRLLYANVITALESYLADFFSSAITEHKDLFRKFVETNPEFDREKVPFSDIFKAWENLDGKVKGYLVEIVWHHLGRIKPMFRDALGVEFPDADELFKAILVRHDLVHRNGKKKDGGEHVLGREDIQKLIITTETFVNGIETAWEKVKPGAGERPGLMAPATAAAAAPAETEAASSIVVIPPSSD
jgi:hypothetical protein